MAEIIKGYIPGSIGRIVEMHGRYYAKNWQFGAVFEAKVAAALSEFIIRYDVDRDAIWMVVKNECIEGSITIDGIRAQDEGAHLRWFILSDVLRGQGFGRRLIEEAVLFCKSRKYPRVYLRTFAGLHAARHLYESVGFVLVHQALGDMWGTEVTEQKFILDLT